ncbi:hypothetical protein CDD81_6946 [Ophiocordyceps australis]|uniref:Uncharacterized protein n=1 Tax=Ophiocordyceps australis TaxID=1399860 RepID=A0A2C5YHT9_9HYPO|nr:hypothetical protein CDD81_6946 [Ophiocordyceps australis]
MQTGHLPAAHARAHARTHDGARDATRQKMAGCAYSYSPGLPSPPVSHDETTGSWLTTEPAPTRPFFFSPCPSCLPIKVWGLQALSTGCVNGMLPAWRRSEYMCTPGRDAWLHEGQTLARHISLCWLSAGYLLAS